MDPAGDGLRARLERWVPRAGTETGRDVPDVAADAPPPPLPSASTGELDAVREALGRAQAFGQEALAEAKRINDLLMAAKKEAFEADARARTAAAEAQAAGAFAAVAYAETQRMNAILLEAQAARAAAEAAAAAATSLAERALQLEAERDAARLRADGLADELARLHAGDGRAAASASARAAELSARLQAKAEESQSRLEHAQLAWSEAKRINDLYVQASRRAVVAEQGKAAVEARAAALDERVTSLETAAAAGVGAARPVLEGEFGPVMKGSWSEVDPFDAASEEARAFLASYHPERPLAPFDVAVLLMMPGWEEELRGNRWHVARFLSRRMPVILVQPRLLNAAGGPVLRRDFRLPGVWVLETRIHQHRPVDDVEEPMLHLRDVRWAVRRLGARAPLYWLFSPYLARVFTALHDGFRLVHATEDWPNFPKLNLGARRGFEAALVAADRIVAVSEGVADALRALPGGDRLAPDRLVVVTNGCDYAAYARAEPHRALLRLKGDGRRVAVFAGNLDYRLDFDLLTRAALGRPELAFVLIGPLRRLDPEDARRWSSLVRLDNVHWLGPFDPEVLPSVYHAADLGIVPYKRLDFIVRSNFSLKLLEMAAAGLPVVATEMRSVVGLAKAIEVCPTPETFLERLGAASRERLTPEQAAELRTAASRNDYDAKFTALLAEIETRRAAAGSAPTPVWADPELGEVARLWRLGATRLLEGEAETARRALTPAARRLRGVLGRRHVTARNLLRELAMSRRAARPRAAFRFLTAAVDPAPTEDLALNQPGVLALWNLCTIAAELGEREAAARAGLAAWERAGPSGLVGANLAWIGVDGAAALLAAGRPGEAAEVYAGAAPLIPHPAPAPYGERIAHLEAALGSRVRAGPARGARSGPSRPPDPGPPRPVDEVSA